MQLTDVSPQMLTCNDHQLLYHTNLFYAVTLHIFFEKLA